MINLAISAKNFFLQILIKLMNNQKFSRIPTLIKNEQIIDNPKIKNYILNAHFAEKSRVNNPSDEVPLLDPLPGIGQCNT